LSSPLYQLVSDQIVASIYFKKIIQYFSLCIIGSERKSRALCRLKNQEVSPGRQGNGGRRGLRDCKCNLAGSATWLIRITIAG